MGKITRLRILFPHGFDTMGFLSFSNDGVGYPTGSVLWRNIWPEGSFSQGCFVQVGMLQPTDKDILGRIVNVPARGIVQGIIYEHIPAGWDEAQHVHSGHWEWLRFSLDFDMNDAGPQTWEGDWHKIRHEGEGFEPWRYSWEQMDD